MTILESEAVRVSADFCVNLFAHSDGVVALHTTASPGGIYTLTSLRMPAAEALRIGAALTKTALAALAHQNAQADAQNESIAA